MKEKLKLLNIEDSELDTELLILHLKKEGYELDYKRVDNLHQLEEALTNEEWDIIISDYSMPGFGVDEALSFVKQTELDVPFIVISGTIGEEKAVKVMRAGASDYLMKDNLKRLAPAIERELHEAENRRRKRESEKSLIESEKRLKLALSAAKMGVWEWDIITEEVVGSSEFYSIWGIEKSVLEKKDFENAIHPEDLSYILQKIGDSIEKHELYEAEYRFIRNGEIRYVSNLGVTEYDEQGNPLKMYGTIQDITDRKKSEKELLESEQRFRALASSAHRVWGSDPDGFIQKPDSSLDRAAISKLSESEYYWWLDLIHPDERESTLEKWKESVKTREIYEIENRIVDEDKGYRYYYVRAVPVFNEDGSVREWVGMNLDITERKLAEESLHKSEAKLIQAQKLESVGRLAGGIAHDFNNMLTAINGYSDLALRKLSANDPLRHYIEEIKKSGERSASLTQQLLAFSRKQVLKPRIIDINNIIHETHSMLSRLIGEDIQFESNLAPDIKLIKVDVGQLSQVIMNLIVNARDAMPDGGKLTIETANVVFDEQFSEFYFEAKPGRYVMLTVSDTGIGMDKEVQKNIFEPFYTTKEISKGTGLGLSTVYGIVKQSGGYIWVYSEPDKGAIFKIYFPQVEDEIKPVIEREPSPSFHSGSETVLLAEDEDMVRNLCRQVLESCGYQVIEAKNGIEALELFKENSAKVDLLMTDIVMPKMGGKELAENLRKLSPGLPILFMSGYPDDAVVRHGIIDAEMNYLQKPFTFNTLTQKVRELLDS